MRRNRRISRYKHVHAIAFIMAAAPVSAISANVISDSTSLKKDSSKLHRIIHQIDAMDIIEKTLKINHDKRADSVNMRPGVIYPAIFPAVGYTTVNGGTAVIAGNFSFYTDSIDKTNLSVVSAIPLVSLKQQVIVPIISTIWLNDNRINILGDWRYYKYPSYTYGLGGYTTLANADMVDYNYIKIYQEVRYRLSKNLYYGIGYNLDYHFNVIDETEETDYDEYPDNASTTVSSGVITHISYDNRANVNNPRNCFYGSLVYRYNSTLLGSDNNWQSVQLEMRKYFKIKNRPEDVLAFWSWNVFTFGPAPYFDLPSTGWDTYANSGRGYIQGRYRGTSLIYFEGEYRLNITRNGLLGATFFVNAQSVPEWPSNKFETINPGEGIGLRIKMNRYSDTNLCIDYGFGNGGSQGIFFNLGEVF